MRFFRNKRCERYGAFCRISGARGSEEEVEFAAFYQREQLFVAVAADVEAALGNRFLQVPLRDNEHFVVAVYVRRFAVKSQKADSDNFSRRGLGFGVYGAGHERNSTDKNAREERR